MYRPLAIIFLFGCCFPGLSQSNYTCIKAVQFKQLLETHHVNPPVWDEALSAKIIDQIFFLIDPQAIYFTANEKKLFTHQVKKLHIALAAGDCAIISELAAVYKNALARTDRIINSISQLPLNFNIPDTLSYGIQGTPFINSESAMQNRWLQHIKFSMLSEIMAGSESARKTTDYKPALAKACKKYRSIIKRKLEIDEGVENYLFNKLLNAIATAYDPHTEYFSSKEKQSFINMISSESYSFGTILEEDLFGNVIVGRIIPGSSAWNSQNVHVGDIVLSIDNPHIDPVDVALYTKEELEEILETLSGDVTLSLRKVNGEQTTITLSKEKVRADENKIKSLVIYDKRNKFGYVNLPVFYSKNEFANTGCATDLAREIIQLKKTNIQGLILDLRNNGGGDLQEAIDLAGIFIDRGALGIIKERQPEAETLKDSNLGTVYDGPLLIMINGSSASASELFASAMQDHKRGLLVGSITYGKGTGQSVMDFTGTDGDLVKITSFKFYRVTGYSHQGIGIMPDITLPDLYSLVDFRENSQRNFLRNDAIQKKTYYTPLAPIPIDVLNDSSNQRIAKSGFFTDIEKKAKYLSHYFSHHQVQIPLSIAGFSEMNSWMANKFSDKKPVTEHYEIKLTTFDQQVNAIDQFGQQTSNAFQENVSRDFYIQEALYILTNYVQLKK